ncbi:unnamed protein product [Albugo candida]|uniref:Secreted protein n=1 Tax=Albugo candida TaxID=65357 RepID=A0A024GDQ1_9STRA|nr:unnamed protein product [Albugo candida]|eukprot:CCI44669.1 unnamed protein product [Albugo candida]
MTLVIYGIVPCLSWQRFCLTSFAICSLTCANTSLHNTSASLWLIVGLQWKQYGEKRAHNVLSSSAVINHSICVLLDAMQEQYSLTVRFQHIHYVDRCEYCASFSCIGATG